MLFGNKQIRTERKVFAELAKKIRKSRSFSVGNTQGNTELYHLDDIDIKFSLNPRILKVSDKSGKSLIYWDCEWRGDYADNVEVFRARFHKFSTLLEKARNRKDKEELKAVKKDKMKYAALKVAMANKKITEQQKAEREAVATLKKIRTL